MKIDLSNKVALITGGSRGIGKGITTVLATCGADVAINYRSNREEAITCQQELERFGRKACIVQADVSKPEEIETLIHTVIKEFGKFDILVNNAGIGDQPDEPELDGSAWDRIMNIHVRAQYLLMRHAIAHMSARNWGRIVNITRLGALVFVKNNYCLSKRFANELTLAFAQHAARSGITINAVAPGSVKTDMLYGAFPEPEAEIKRRLEKIPGHQMAEPEEIGGIVAFLCSDYASYIVGSIINASGGEIVGK